MTEQRIELGLASAPTGGCGTGCGCGHASAASLPDSSGSQTDVIRVTGMTCAHCVRAVTEELSHLDGVEVLGVDLRVGEASLVRLSSTGAVDEQRIAAAIDEAGYTLVP